VVNWDPSVYNAMAVGDSAVFGGTITGSGWYRGSIRRLNDLLFLARSEGFSRDSNSRQQTGMLLRLRPVELDITAALKTQGQVKVGGSSFTDGNDNLPPGWTGCPALEPALPGIQLPDSSGSNFTTSGCGGLSCIAGNPKIEEDSTINDSTLTTFGDANFDDWEDLATKRITGGNRKIEPSVVGSQCNKADPNNLGSPLAPTGTCGGYFPITWVDGDLTVNGVQGQGVLLVNGDLDVQGGFEFYGPVIVKGRLSTQGTGGHFNGGVIAANVDLDQNTVLGNAVISFSSCALAKALQNSAPAAPLRSRSWANLY
ncbi:MAG: hypothetical protein OEW06_16510, partial [Gemmatimonadota bacterium]|nr:hypothetical protein [Gemmatimonadota bacterium]